MLGLKHSQYLPVLLEKSDAQPLLFHPAYIREWQQEQDFLKSQNDIFHSPWTSKEHFFSLIQKISPEKEIKSNFSFFTNTLKDISLRVSGLPNTSDEIFFKKSFHGKILGMCELFNKEWNTHNIGSARNALLSKLQYKGVGRTLPVNSFDHLMASGKLSLSEAVHSFIISQLCLVTFPLASLPIQAVYMEGNSDSNDSFIVRSNDAIRVAQISDRLDSDELTYLLLHLQQYFPGSSTKVIIEKIMAQYAAISFLGSEFTSSADNLLLNGKILDEESWIWPQELGELRMVVTCRMKDDLKGMSQIDWDKVYDVKSSFEILDQAVQKLLKAFNHLGLETPSLTDSRKMFLNHLTALFSINRELSKNQIEDLWSRSLELSSMNAAELKRWAENLKGKGFKFNFSETKRKGHYLLEITSAHYRASELRPSRYSKRFEKLQKMGSLKTDLSQKNASIFSLISRNAHLLPYRSDEINGTPVPNQTKISIWWQAEMERLEAISKNISGLNYRENGVVKKIKFQSDRMPKFKYLVEPISFDYHGDLGFTLEIPAKKSLLVND